MEFVPEKKISSKNRFVSYNILKRYKKDDTEAGMKAAAKFYNQAAGIFVFIRENIAGVLNKESPTSDLVQLNLNCLSQYCLACAQEAVYTHAKSGRMKQGTIAKVCQVKGFKELLC